MWKTCGKHGSPQKVRGNLFVNPSCYKVQRRKKMGSSLALKGGEYEMLNKEKIIEIIL